MTYSIDYSQGTYYQEADLLHRFFAIEDGVQIGELYIDIDRLIIMNIDVDQDRRGEGIARALYTASVAKLGEVLHAPEEARTPEGHGFAQAVGGPVADDMEELHG